MDRIADARLATARDANVLSHLLRDFNAEYGEDSPADTVLRARLTSQLSDGTAWAVLGHAEGTPVGFATVYPRASAYGTGAAAYLEDLYVRPGDRGGGVGGAMVALVLAHARAAGAGAVEVGVDEGDLDVLRFYARHGFGQREGAMGERAWHLEVDLS